MTKVDDTVKTTANSHVERGVRMKFPEGFAKPYSRHLARLHIRMWKGRAVASNTTHHQQGYGT